MKFQAWRQSHMLILIIGDGKTFLNEILISTIQNVISRIDTAVYSARAVTKRRFDLRWLNAFIPAFSRLKLISLLATARFKSEAVYNIKNFIARTYSDPGLSIKDISVYAHLSTSYMCTMFKNETGRTLNQYITEFRMARAKDLLDDPRNKIVEVAGQVGYNDSNYFSKTFRKAFGMSPSEYREQSAPGGGSWRGILYGRYLVGIFRSGSSSL